MKWVETTVGDFCPVSYGKGLASGNRNGGRVPVFGSNGIVGWHDSAIVHEPSIIIGRKGSVGEIHFSESPCWPIDTAFYATGSANADIRFAYYLYQTLPIKVNSDSAVPGLNRDFLQSLRVLVPERINQQTIASILATLDEKIRLNTELSKTLEAIAQTIFKSWFIDFDPVHAKARGEQPEGMDAETAALFPDSFEDSELGPIPKGWGISAIGDIIERHKPGKIYDQKKVSTLGEVPVLDQGKSGVIGFHDDAPGVCATPDNPFVVFANHTCSLRIVSFPFSCIQNVFPLKGNGVDTKWLFFAVQGKQKFDSYKGHWPDFVLKKVVVSNDQLSNRFGAVVDALLRLQWAATAESSVLSCVRDSLLPRLISGELEIPEEMLAS